VVHWDHYAFWLTVDVSKMKTTLLQLMLYCYCYYYYCFDDDRYLLISKKTKGVTYLTWVLLAQLTCLSRMWRVTHIRINLTRSHMPHAFLFFSHFFFVVVFFFFFPFNIASSSSSTFRCNNRLYIKNRTRENVFPDIWRFSRVSTRRTKQQYKFFFFFFLFFCQLWIMALTNAYIYS